MTNGESPDWDGIVEQHAGRVFRVALRILRSVQDAEDVSQDVFTEAFRLHRAGPIQSWTGLLVRLATLRSLDRLRRNRPTVELREGEQLSRDHVSAALGVSPEAVSTALYKARQRLLAQLAVFNQKEIPHERRTRLPDFRSLEPPLEAAVRAALAAPIPGDAVERVKTRARGLAASTLRASSPLARRRKASRPLVAGLTAAAALLVTAATGFFLLSPSNGQAFAQMIEKVILSRDRVPATIAWDAQGKTITALMRDPESVPTMERLQGELRQWDVATGRLRWADNRLVPREWTQTVDGKTLATVYNLEVELRDAATGKITRTWGTDEPLSQLAFSPDGKTLAAGVAEWGKHGGRGGKQWGGVQFWDVERSALLRSIKSDDKPVVFVKYSVDGKFLATSAGPAVKLWNAATGEVARIFPGIHRAAFSPDGKTIACQAAASSADKTVGRVDLYDLRDGALVRSFAGEKGASASWICCITFSPDGRSLAASDWNGIVTLWDVATGERRLTIKDHQAGVLSVAFAPDGATLATGSEDKTLRLRKLPAW